MKRLLCLLCVFATYTLGHSQIYVTEISGGLETGTSWADAFTDLQTAIYEANAGDTIWVAQGSYEPFLDTLGLIPPVPKSRHFWLKNGVVIYGGFDGSETSLSQRDPVNRKATLEGEVIPGQFAEQVLKVYSSIDSTAVLDGFIIQNGKSVDTSTSKNGSGVLLYGDAGFYNVLFRNNVTENQGGAVYAQNSSSIFVNCRFQSNQVTNYDGAACNLVYSDIKMYNCVFDSNQAARFGGAITTVESDLLVQNGTFFGNSGGSNIFQFSTSGDIRLKNCIFDANTSPVVMGSSGGVATFVDGLMPMNNSWLILCPTCIGATPTFANLGAGDYSLAQGSRGIDEALNAVPVNNYNDYAGNPRLVGSSMDMGAFEFQGAVGISPNRAISGVSIYPNPSSELISVQSDAAIESVQIFNTSGQLLQTESSGHFSVATLAQGLYLLQVKTAHGIQSIRFVRE